MSSIQRSRSLRKPTTTSNAAPTSLEPSFNGKADTRNASPSRLPVKPPARTVSSATASSKPSSTISSSSGLASRRPISGTLGRAPSVRQAAAATASGDPPKRDATSKYPPLSSGNRPVPTGRPTSSGGATTQTKRGPTHTRTKSTTATSSGASSASRPPSREQAGLSRPGAGSLHTRKTSVDKANGASAPAATRTTTSAASRTTASSAAAQHEPRLRPGFTTLQQHYSPAKSLAPKQATAAFLAPPSPSKLPANVAASAETSRLQIELLQLHLLHRDASAIHSQWRQSARDKLELRFSELSAASQDVDEQQRAGAERESVLALRRWAVNARGAGSDGLEDKVQALDAVINGVWALSDPGGRYARVIRRFERWVDRVGEIEEARKLGDSLSFEQSGGVLFVSELDSSWRDESEGLIRRLDGWSSQLRQVGSLPLAAEQSGETDLSRSSLARMIEGSRNLIEDMLAELRIMEEIVAEALGREEAWLEKMIKQDDDDHDTPKAGAIWRIL